MSSAVGLMKEGFCATHPDRAARAICNRCGDFICSACTRRNPQGENFCARCFEQNVHNAEPLEWEMRSELGFPQAFWQTLVQSITKPNTFFKKVDPNGPYLDAYLYSLLCNAPNVIGTVLIMATMMLGQGLPGSPLKEIMKQSAPAEVGLIVGIGVGIIVLFPVLVFLAQLMFSGMLFLCCKLVGADSGGFKGTFRALAYCVAPNFITGSLMVLVSLIGLFNAIAMLIASYGINCISLPLGLYTLVLYVFALRDVHRTTTGRAIGAIAIFFGATMLLVCGCYGLGIAAFVLALPTR